MHVLVAYASRHGSTLGIAGRVADRLRSHGLEVDLVPAAAVRAVAGYDAVVIGGAAYMFSWLKDATTLVRRQREALRSRPTWLFSSGPVGTDLVDKEGRDVFVTSRPKEWPELIAAIAPRGTKVFFGAWDPAQPPASMAERFVRAMPATRDLMPAGDFRDWPAIDAWADEIAVALETAPVPA